MKQALLIAAALGCVPQVAARAAPAVGSPSQAQLQAEIATARAAEALARRPQTAVTARNPTFADDVSQGRVVGET